MGRPREHDQRTRVALLAAAEELLASGGEQALSVRTVADRAGTSTRAVYSLFGSKEGLLSALGQHGFDLLSDALDGQAASDDPIADIVRAATHGFRPWTLSHPQLFRLAFDRLGMPTQRAAAAAFGRVRARVRRAHEAGLLGDHDVDEVTIQVNALCEGLGLVERRLGPAMGPGPERIWREALEALLAGMRG